ncbi:MAG: universal stress protein [Acidimicrobiales bacterium]|nr:universal stress protein [Acidimicrobiales bacterium]
MNAAAPATPYVVLGDDLSPGSDLAWLWVNSQHWPGWTLVDLQAEPPAFGRQVPPEDAAPHPVVGDPPRDVIAESGFAEVRFEVATSDPRLALSGWPDATLVVVGGASSGVGPRSVGSTTEWLLHDPTNPVVLARRGRSVRTAIVCADGSAHASDAATTLAGLPWSGEVAVSALAVDDGRTDTDAAIDAVTQVLDGHVASVSGSVHRGRKPHREILAEARTSDPDLIVLGTHGLTTIRRLTLGSTANAVAQLAGCSVLVSRSRLGE